MKKQLLFCLTILLLLTAGMHHSYAAFKVTPNAHDEPTPTVVVHTHKTFGQRKLPVLVKQAHARVFPHDGTEVRGKQGWQGVASFACGVLAFVTLIALSSAVLFTVLTVGAIVLGAVGLSQRTHTNTGFAIAGLVLGIIGAIILTLAVIIAVSFLK